MRLKSYFSASVEAAMQLARKELGEDALLVNARPATPETRYLGAYEVVFGLAPVEAAPAPAPAVRLRGEVDELRRQVDRLTRSLSEPPKPLEVVSAPLPEPGDLTPGLSRQLQAGAALSDLIAVDATLGPITALVGPPGVGKTSTILKLAVRYGLAQRRTVHMLSADVNRIAAADQLRSLCSILGIGCGVVETPSALAHAIAEHRSKSLLLIDTPGLALTEMDQAADLAAILKAGGVDTHLLLPASMKMADVSRLAAAYKQFDPSKLLFTRLDETSSFASMANLAAETKLPLSFLTSGQRIPDDLEEGNLERLRDLIFGGDAPLPITPRRLGAAA